MIHDPCTAIDYLLHKIIGLKPLSVKNSVLNSAKSKSTASVTDRSDNSYRDILMQYILPQIFWS